MLHGIGFPSPLGYRCGKLSVKFALFDSYLALLVFSFCPKMDVCHNLTTSSLFLSIPCCHGNTRIILFLWPVLLLLRVRFQNLSGINTIMHCVPALSNVLPSIMIYRPFHNLCHFCFFVFVTRTFYPSILTILHKVYTYIRSFRILPLSDTYI